jgi:hypothetical protein
MDIQLLLLWVTGKNVVKHLLQVVGSHLGSVSGPPSIGPIGRSKILDSVKRFLPEMAKAEVDLKQRLEAGEDLDVEACSGFSIQ